MADAIYKQALGRVIAQLPQIGDGLSPLVADTSVFDKARELDWDDVVELGGLTVRFDSNAIREDTEGTNERDIYGYPCFVIHAQGATREMGDDIHSIEKFFRDVRRYYHNKRRMGLVSETGVNELPCKVANGPRPSANFLRQHGAKVRSLTIWAWFLEPRTA